MGSGGRTWPETPNPQHMLQSFSQLHSQDTERKLLRTPCSDWRVLTPKHGAPFLHWAPDHEGPCDYVGRRSMQSALGLATAFPSNPYFSYLPEPCSYEGRVFQDGEDWPLSPCAKCVCRNGVAQCFTAQCQPLFCNQVRKTASEWILHRLLASLFRNSESLLRLCQAGLTRNKKQRPFCFPYTFGDHPWDMSFSLRSYRQD